MLFCAMCEKYIYTLHLYPFIPIFDVINMTGKMGTQKLLKIEKETIGELKIITAEVNAKSVNSYLEDMFLHLSKAENKRFDPPVMTGELTTANYVIDDGILYELRIVAANLGTSLKAYMEAAITWLANEHRTNGRVWIDDTPIRSLPIRMRK